MTSSATTPTYSFVLPVFNEEAALPAMRDRLLALIDKLDGPAEVIFVDDGSRDTSYALLATLSASDARFKCVRLSRNFGHQVAITAGIDYAAGDAVIVMDADLQDPPEVVLEMIGKWRQGFDVVYGKRRTRKGETIFKRASAAIFYRTLRALSDVDIPSDVGDFRLMDRAVVDALAGMRENNRYVRGMIAWLGFAQTAVEYVRDERVAGETKYPLMKMMKLGANGVVGFSTAPLRFCLQVGFGVSFAAFALGILLIIGRVLGVYMVTGWASLIVVVFFVGGLQLLMVGVIGEYIGRIYDEVKRRPLYLVRATDGFTHEGRNPHARLVRRRPTSAAMGGAVDATAGAPRELVARTEGAAVPPGKAP